MLLEIASPPVDWPELLLGAGAIACARVFDVALGVLRHASVLSGRTKSAWVIAFFEALIWVIVVSRVVGNLTSPVYAVAYAIGFASGNVVGILIERALGRGEQVVRIFTRHGAKMAEEFRNRGYRVTIFEGAGRDGPIQLLFIHVIRKAAPAVAPIAYEFDEECFIVVDDVRSSSLGGHGYNQATYIRK